MPSAILFPLVVIGGFLVFCNAHADVAKPLGAHDKSGKANPAPPQIVPPAPRRASAQSDLEKAFEGLDSQRAELRAARRPPEPPPDPGVGVPPVVAYHGFDAEDDTNLFLQDAVECLQWEEEVAAKRRQVLKGAEAESMTKNCPGLKESILALKEGDLNPEQVTLVIGCLGNKSYQTRQLASQVLEVTGPGAKKLLQEAAEKGGAEVRRRAKSILAVRNEPVKDLPDNFSIAGSDEWADRGSFGTTLFPRSGYPKCLNDGIDRYLAYLFAAGYPEARPTYCDKGSK